jgi:hypothetical protein
MIPEIWIDWPDGSDYSMLIEMRSCAMAGTKPRRIPKRLQLMRRQLGLCRHAAVGALPTSPRRKDEGRLA